MSILSFETVKHTFRGYCAIVSITNDSSVSIAPIFYCALGLGIGINAYIKKYHPESIVKRKKKEAEETKDAETEASEKEEASEKVEAAK